MILFTGLTGTSGSALVDVLTREGILPFRVIVRKSSDLTGLENSGLQYELVYGDIRDANFLAKAMDGVDTVFHIASKAAILSIAKAAVAASVKNCIFVSSTSIFSEFRAASDKIISDEAEMKRLFSEHGVAWTIIRPTMIFGSLNDHNVARL